MSRVWYRPPWKLTGPILGVPGFRPPFYRGGDEYGRDTLTLQLPLLGAVTVAYGQPGDVSDDSGQEPR